ncbi:MAG: hybrid sensor histidine kinase/response regulator [Bacteroidales bacterium]|nr:MAG: hybrid sensor histidine kinase/response regulator [Bacteroidales bacterium]
MNYSGKVLVVDDSKLINSYISEILIKNNFLPISAYSGSEALQLLAEGMPDLILLDIVLPDITGFEVYAEIHKDASVKDIPVIFLTGISDAENIKKGLELGAIDYIPKPFKDIELTLKIVNHFKTINANKQIKEREKKLEEYSRELEELNSTKNKFFSIIAHDLKNPLHLLMGLSNELMDNIQNLDIETVKEVVKGINSTSKQTFNLLENLLEWARMQTGNLQAKPERISCKAIIAEIKSLFDDAAKKKNIELIFENDTDAYIYADAAMMKTVLRNLVSNAIKFTSCNGEVSVNIQEHSDVCDIIVADNGIGIDPAHVEKIFRIDSKLSKIGTANEEGTGLGLLLCKEFVEKNNGAISVESQRGKGSRFIISMPLMD